jgi:capsular polysaccharide transport system permease protein
MAAGGLLDGHGSKAVRDASAWWQVLPRALGSQIRILGRLVFREGRTQFAESPFRALFELVEPLIFILGLYLLHEFLMSSTPFGTSPLMFLATGVTPYFLFLGISSGVRGSARDIRSLRNFPLVTPLDLISARCLYELLAAAPMYGLLFWSMWLYGIPEATPASVDKIVGSVAVIFIFGFGFGMINACITTFIPQWMLIFKVTGRLMMITSGVHRVPEYLPEYFRQYVVWNPLMHAVEWFRSGFYMLYPTYSLDIGYLLSWAAVTFVLGLAFERAVRPRLYRGKKDRV